MIEIKYQCLIVSLTCATVGISLVTNRFINGWSGARALELAVEAALFLFSVVVAVLALDVYRRGPASSHTFSSLYVQYRHVQKMLYHGRRVRERHRRSTAAASKVQTDMLMRILLLGSQTKYGKDKKLDEIKSFEEYRERVPISTYDDYVAYVGRVVKGEEDVLFAGKPLYLCTTSGTTGKYKIFPKNKNYFDIATDYLSYYTYCVVYTHYPSCALKKILTLQTYREPNMTGDGGYPQGPATSAFASYKPFYVVPHECYFITANKAAVYTSLLFALRERDIGMIYCFFTSTVLVFFQKMQADWENLCMDIHLGRIRRDFAIPEDKLPGIMAHFSADPKRADNLRWEFKKGFDGIAKRIWPGLEITVIISTGAFKASADVLKQSYLRGVTNFSRLHGGSEGIYGLCDATFGYDTEYEMTPDTHFFELLPLDDGQNCLKTVLPKEAEIGKKYEIVLTTDEGLYRYRNTDVIEVVGFAGEFIKYKFSQRVGDILNLTNEKTPVHVVETALYAALRSMDFKGTVTDYCCTENVHIDKITGGGSGQLAYYIFVETEPNHGLPRLIDEEVDEALKTALDSYRSHRNQGTASQVKVAGVKAGTFAELRALILAMKPTTAIDQYKTPRMTREPDFLRLFLTNLLKVTGEKDTS